MMNITCAFSSSRVEERMTKDCIIIYGFLKDITSMKGEDRHSLRMGQASKKRVVEEDQYYLRTRVWRFKIVIVLKGHTLWTSKWGMYLREVVRYHT